MNNKIRFFYGLFICLCIISSTLISCKQDIEPEITKENSNINKDTIPPALVSSVSFVTGNNFVFLSWINPIDTDFEKVEIMFSPIVENTSQTIYVLGEAGKQSSVKIENLINDTEYVFSISSIDKNNNKSECVTVKATPKIPEDKTPPAPITNLLASSGDNFVQLSWINPSDTDFKEVEIIFSPNNNNLSQPIHVGGKAGQNSSVTIENLVNGTEYIFSISSLDTSNKKSECVSVKATPKLNIEEPPEQPIDVEVPGPVINLSGLSGDCSVLLSWTNPSDDDFKLVEICFTPEIDNLSQPIKVFGISGEVSSINIENLINDVEYIFSLIAIDTNDNKSKSTSIKIIPKSLADITPPSDISSVSAIGKHQCIELSWTNPNDDDFYATEITCSPAIYYNGDWPKVIRSNPSENDQIIIRNLNNGTEYTFIIQTIDKTNNKSSGITVKATPKEGNLSFNVSLPNDDGENIILTNDIAPIEVQVISSSSDIKQAIWIESTYYSNNGEVIFTEPQAKQISFDDDLKGYFNVEKNGIYYIVVQNDEEMIQTEYISVYTIDKVAPDNVKDIWVDCDGTNIKINWENPRSIDNYDSPLKELQISYIFNDDITDPNNGRISVTPDLQNCLIGLPGDKSENDYMKIIISAIDELGNTSEGAIQIAYCYDSVIMPWNKIEDIIPILTRNRKIVINGILGGSYYDWKLYNAINTALYNNRFRKFDLDLSLMTELTCVKSLSSISNLSSIILPDTIISIEDSAFASCSNLTSITIPEELITIGKEAFSGCINLNNISIPNSVNSIGDKAFFGCANLISIRIPNNVTAIGNEVFYGCTNLASVILPESLSVLSDGLFYDCENLSSIIIPGTVISIGEKTFYNCIKLTNVIIPNGVTTIGESAFYSCESLSSITIPNSVNSLGQSAFQNCKMLENVCLSNGLIALNDSVFSGCVKLDNVIVPSNVKTIYYSFSGCKNLKNITLPYGVTTIGYGTFSGCENLESIEIPATVTIIDDRAFWECSSLSNINIPSSVKDIGNYAFLDCTDLSSVSFEEGLQTIGEYSFQNCTGLTSITIPKSLSLITSYSFKGCSNLKNVTFLDTRSKWYMTRYKGGPKVQDFGYFGGEHDYQYVIGNDAVGQYYFYKYE